MSKTVEKKILPQYIKKVSAEKKTFEIRKDEDDIQEGDILILREWDGEKYTGKKCVREVTYVLRDVPEYGLQDGYCVIAMQPRGWNWISPSSMAEVKSGEWMKASGTETTYICSNCGESVVMWKDYSFCPFCGSRLYKQTITDND